MVLPTSAHFPSPFALPLLHHSATLASLSCPQPAYICSFLLSSSFTSLYAPAPLCLRAFHPRRFLTTLDSRKHPERAAYLHFGPAQNKIGRAHEFVEPPRGFDPVLSVIFYELASRAGESEAHLVSSKCFLCGSTGEVTGDGASVTGGFEKDEGLTLVFAEKAARKGLASAEFVIENYAGGRWSK